MSRSTILFCVTKSVWGGAQRYVYDLATHIPKDRFIVAVAAGGNGPLFTKLQEQGIRTHEISALGRDVHFTNEIRAFFDLYKIIKKENPDVVHLNSSKLGLTGAVAAKLAGFHLHKKIKIIFTVHGWVFNEDRPQIQKKILYILTRIGTIFQDHIIVINTRDYDTAKKFIPEKKLAFIFNGIEPPTFYPREHARKELSQKINRGLQEKNIVIGTIAELTKNKGVIHLVDAVQRLKDLPQLHTVVIGDGEEREVLLRKITQHGLGEKISIAGFIPDAARYLHGFDIFVLPSLKEGLPYAILEAMEAGLPVIASDIGGIPDLIEHKKNGFLVPAKNAGHLASTLRRVVGDTTLQRKIGNNAKEIRQTKFSLNAMIKKTMKLYLSHHQ